MILFPPSPFLKKGVTNFHDARATPPIMKDARPPSPPARGVPNGSLALEYHGVRRLCAGADCGLRRVPRLLGAARRKHCGVFHAKVRGPMGNSMFIAAPSWGGPAEAL